MDEVNGREGAGDEQSEYAKQITDDPWVEIRTPRDEAMARRKARLEEDRLKAEREAGGAIVGVTVEDDYDIEDDIAGRSGGKIAGAIAPSYPAGEGGAGDAEAARAEELARLRAEEQQVPDDAAIAESFDEIADTDDLPTEDVWVPEWKKVCTLQTWSREVRDGFERAYARLRPEGTAKIDDGEFVSLVVSLSWVHKEKRDEHGNRQRMIVGKEQRAALRRKNAVAVARLFRAGLRLNGMSTDARETTKKN